MTDQKSAPVNGNRPTHRVVYQSRFKDGYGQPVQLGGAWQNKAGGISFSFAGGSLTIWPADRKNDTGASAN